MKKLFNAKIEVRQELVNTYEVTVIASNQAEAEAKIKKDDYVIGRKILSEETDAFKITSVKDLSEPNCSPVNVYMGGTADNVVSDSILCQGTK